MSFGGFLGMGEKHHPLPWATLKYDTQKGGYVVNLDKKQLEGRRRATICDSEFKWTPYYGRKVTTTTRCQASGRKCCGRRQDPDAIGERGLECLPVIGIVSHAPFG